jgi:hypothetical protein
MTYSERTRELKKEIRRLRMAEEKANSEEVECDTFWDRKCSESELKGLKEGYSLRIEELIKAVTKMDVQEILNHPFGYEGTIEVNAGIAIKEMVLELLKGGKG